MGFFSDYKNNVKEFRLEEPMDFLFYRPFAYIIVKLTLFLPLNPNHFTVLAVLSALGAGVALSQGTREGMLLGGALILLFGIFDCCDGMVARLKKNSSKYGDLIDMFADSISNIFYFTGLFIGSKKMFPQGYVPYLIVASIIVLSIHVTLYNYYKKQFFFYRDKNPEGRNRELDQYRRDYEELKRNSKWNFNRLLLGLYLKFAKAQKDPEESDLFDMDRYVECNRSILPLWGVIAGSSHLTILAIALVLGNLNVFFYFTLLLANLWMILITIVQSGVNSNLRVES